MVCCGGVCTPSTCAVQCSTGLLAVLGTIFLFRVAVLGETVKSALSHIPVLGDEPSAAAQQAFLGSIALVLPLRIVFLLRPMDKALTQINVVVSILQAMAISYLFYINIIPTCFIVGAGAIKTTNETSTVVAALTNTCFLKKLGMLCIVYCNVAIQMCFWQAREEGTLRSSESRSVSHRSESPVKKSTSRKRGGSKKKK